MPDTDTRTDAGTPGTSPTRTASELATQPECWRRAAAAAAGGEFAPALPRPGERVAVVGCGTSWFMAQSYAALREAAGQGETDAFAASAFPRGRVTSRVTPPADSGAQPPRYDRVLALTRSGTTSEVLELLAALKGAGARLSAVTADPHTPVAEAAETLAVLDFADEESVVQTRFATTALALLRAALGEEQRAAVLAAADQAERVLGEPLPEAVAEAEQWTFLGTDWSCGVAQEAALKMREAAGAWTEAYPAMEYRHGPISVTGPGRVAWMLGELPAGLAAQIAATGGTLVDSPLDPLADLVRVHRLAVEVAARRGLDPDRPRALTRSVILG